jgi:tetratricopeptide (TPR) repeat protein
VFGGVEQAAAAFREAIRLDPKFVAPYVNVVGTLIALNRIDEAEDLLRQASAHHVDFISIRRMAYLVAFMKNDRDAMARELNAALATPEAVWGANWEGRTFIFEGRFEAAHKAFQQSIQAALQSNAREFAAQWMVEDAEIHALAGACGEARKEIAAGLEWSRDNFTLERAAHTLAFCGVGGEASTIFDELSSRYADATMTRQLQIPVARAALAVRQGESARAIEILEPLKPYDHSMMAEFWPAYLRGQAYLQAKDGRSAAIQFQSIVSHRGEQPTSPLFPLAHLGLARAQAAAGDAAAARQAYQNFLELWANADPALPALVDARAELERLR